MRNQRLPCPVAIHIPCLNISLSPTNMLFVLVCLVTAEARLFGGDNRPQRPVGGRGGILNGHQHGNPHVAGHMGGGGGILGGGGAGAGGRAGILHAMENSLPGGRPNKAKEDRIRHGPIVFDPQNLQYDDNDGYSNEEDDEEAISRPQLGLDLSNIFLPLVNFMAYSGKSMGNLLSLLDKQANFLLGRSEHREGQISVVIVLIISWLVIGVVIYALAQVAAIRRLSTEEEIEDEVDDNFVPSLRTTPPTPTPTPEEKVNRSNGHAVAHTKATSVTSRPVWLPSVGALQLSESTILKRRESTKRKRISSRHGCKLVKSDTVVHARNCGPNVDSEALLWVESGLERAFADDIVHRNVLLKWKEFLSQHVMQPVNKDGLSIDFQRLREAPMPSIANVDVEMSDEQNLIVTLDIESSFLADIDVMCDVESQSTHHVVKVERIATRVECKISREDDGDGDTLVHIRQTGHVDLLLHVTPSSNSLRQLVINTVVNALKNVDCDLPPLQEICKSPQASGLFVSSPSSFSSPSPSNGGQQDNHSPGCEDRLSVSLVKASLSSLGNVGRHTCHPYVILEMDHPAQRFQTIAEKARYTTATSQTDPATDFYWENSQFHFNISREKTHELLVEMWDGSDNKNDSKAPVGGSLSACCEGSEDNLSPAAVGHRFIGLCLVSVQDLMTTPSQTHMVSLQGRPFLDDDVVEGMLTLQFFYVPDSSKSNGIIAKNSKEPAPLTLQPSLALKGVHKTLEMKHFVGVNGQAVFSTSSTYIISQSSDDTEEPRAIEPVPPTPSSVTSSSSAWIPACESTKSLLMHVHKVNAVAQAAVRDLQMQRSLRMGTPPATRSTMLIRSVYKLEGKYQEENVKRTSHNGPQELGSTSICDQPTVANSNATSSDAESRYITSHKGNGQPKKNRGGAKKKSLISTIKKKLRQDKRSRKKSRHCSSKESSNLSSSVIEEEYDKELRETDHSVSDEGSISSCSGRSSCCTEQSFELTNWRGTLSSSWQSVASGSSYLLVPSGGGDDVSSLSEASGISTTSGSYGGGLAPPPFVPSSSSITSATSMTSNPNAALILETVEQGITRHYLIPHQLATKGRLKRKGLKLHVFMDHLFVAKHIKSGTMCSLCRRKINPSLGKQGYLCRDCGLVCHKSCHVKAENTCPNSSVNSMELKHHYEEKTPILTAQLEDWSRTVSTFIFQLPTTKNRLCKHVSFFYK